MDLHDAVGRCRRRRRGEPGVTAYSRLPNMANVVGTSKLGLVIAPLTVPLPRFGASATAAIRLFVFWTT